MPKFVCYGDFGHGSRLLNAIIEEGHNCSIQIPLPDRQSNTILTNPASIAPRGLCDPRKAQHPIGKVPICQQQSEAELVVILLRPYIQEVVYGNVTGAELIAWGVSSQDIDPRNQGLDPVRDIIRVLVKIGLLVDLLDLGEDCSVSTQ